MSECYQSRPGAWCRPSGWFRRSSPSLWLRPDVCWAGCRSGSSAAPAPVWAPWRWLQQSAEKRQRRLPAGSSGRGRGGLTLYVVLLQVYPLQQRDQVGAAFPRAVLRSCQDVAPGQRDGNALLLQRKWHHHHQLEETSDSEPLNERGFMWRFKSASVWQSKTLKKHNSLPNPPEKLLSFH